jgi:3-hydroxyisobutyrate dehydrogenase-like beta-hydroxyacid dehydrogenase
LGNQGKPIATQYVRAGFDATVYDISKQAMDDLVAEGAVAAATPSEVGGRSDVVGICVPADHHVREVCLGPQGLLAAMEPGSVIAIHSTIQPDTAREMAAEGAKTGVGVLDACVTGGAAAAEARSLTFMVGGEDAVLEKARPVIDVTAKTVIHAGPVGRGCILKLCINLITYTLWSAAHESAELAEAAGLPLELLEQAGASNGQITPMMKQFLAARAVPEEVRASEAYQAIFRSHTAIAEKDLDWALALARKSGVRLPVAGLLAQRMDEIYGLIE